MSQEQVEIRLPFVPTTTQCPTHKMDTLQLVQIAATALAALHNEIEEDCGTIDVDSHSDPGISNNIQVAKAASDLWAFLQPTVTGGMPF